MTKYKATLPCKQCKIPFQRKGRNTTAKFCSSICYNEYQKANPNKGNYKKGRIVPLDEIQKITKSRLGVTGYWKNKKLSKDIRLKMSKTHKERVSLGLNHLWKGGITPINRRVRMSIEYKLWRTSVFTRDNWTCVFCKERGGKLNADHIKPFAYYPELRFAIDNGRTLCVPCHKTTDTWGHRGIAPL